MPRLEPVLDELLARCRAELDVRAAAGHVGRDHHRAELPGVLDDVRLALVLLGVEHLVLDLVLRVSSWLIISLFSTLVVPTSIGRPDVVEVLDLVDDRRPTCPWRAGTSGRRSRRAIGLLVGIDTTSSP
jgi:hypothetical protein